MRNLEIKHNVKFNVVKNDANSPAIYVDIKRISQGIIIVQERVLKQTNLRDCLLHEIGHVLDYREDKTRFYVSSLVSMIQKIKILDMPRGRARVQKYHATSIERRANAHFGLSYNNFCK